MPVSAVFRSHYFNRFFAVLILGSFAIGVIAPFDGRAEDDGLGYKYTPQLPNSKWRVHDRNRPQAPKVVPGETPGAPPSDAVVLFDGTDFTQWEKTKAKNLGAESGDDALDRKLIQDGSFDIMKTGWIQTKQHFGDCQLHIEWAAPKKADAGNLDWGNSGIFFLGQYELQVLESHDNKIYADGMAGAIYGQTPPLANPARKPGEWQTFDVIFTAPRFAGEKLLSPAYITVLWNGVLVQNHTEIMGSTRHLTFPNYRSFESSAPLVIQPHRSAVRYRNIWIRPL
ncbi:MAG: DUF1080 domain-containing protein [Pirellulaceae bacterium]|nr:DUF1080 domain-containing protein [Pirellulaceae bacterium]